MTLPVARLHRDAAPWGQGFPEPCFDGAFELVDSRVLKDPAPQIAVSEMADSSVNFVVRPWCNRTDYWAVKFDLTKAFKEQLEAGGCSIPFPQRDVHLHQAPAACGSSGWAPGHPSTAPLLQ